MPQPTYRPENETEKLMWDFIAERGEFTHDLLKASVEVSDYERTNFVAKLKRRGHLTVCGKRDMKTLFTIHDSDARRTKTTAQRQSPEGVMWTVMRVTREFSAQDICLSIGSARPDITPKSVSTYCQKLFKAGYFKVTQTAKPPVRPARYLLINDTGPLPPTIHRKEVIIDGNDGKPVYVQGTHL